MLENIVVEIRSLRREMIRADSLGANSGPATAFALALFCSVIDSIRRDAQVQRAIAMVDSDPHQLTEEVRLSVLAINSIASAQTVSVTARVLENAGWQPPPPPAAEFLERVLTDVRSVVSLNSSEVAPRQVRLAYQLDRLQGRVCRLASQFNRRQAGTYVAQAGRRRIIRTLSASVATVGVLASIVGIAVDREKFAQIFLGDDAIPPSVHDAAVLCVEIAKHAETQALECIEELVRAERERSDTPREVLGVVSFSTDLPSTLSTSEEGVQVQTDLTISPSRHFERDGDNDVGFTFIGSQEGEGDDFRYEWPPADERDSTSENDEIGESENSKRNRDGYEDRD